MKKSRKQLAEHVGKLISNDRNKTHGDPHIQFACAQELKAIVVKYLAQTDRELPSSAAEALDMNLTKISRIICGQNAQDHWLDLAGYSLIAAEETQG